MGLNVSLHTKLMRRLRSAALFLGCFWTALSLYAAELTGVVIGISDGDTLTILSEAEVPVKIRLLGIDAPEKSQPFGQRSRQSLSELAFGKRVVVDWHKRDRYGRIVGKVTLPDGTDTNLEQIKRGLAWHYKQYANEQPKPESGAYGQAELQSASRHIGLWADPSPVPPWEYRRRNTK